MDILTPAGLNLPQEPTSVKDIHICYIQYIRDYITISIYIFVFEQPSGTTSIVNSSFQRQTNLIAYY